jgi:hypothetical protein
MLTGSYGGTRSLLDFPYSELKCGVFKRASAPLSETLPLVKEEGDKGGLDYQILKEVRSVNNLYTGHYYP